MGLRKYKEAGCDGMDLKGDISMVDCATLRLVLELLPVPALALKCKFSIVSSKLMTLGLQKHGNPLQKSAMSTTPVTETRNPHSGYHFDGSSHEFFEGWYFKVSILEVKQSFAWMYVSKNLGTATSSSKREGGACGPSSVAQIMGANDEYLFQDQPFVKSLWYDRHELALGNTFHAKSGALPPMSETSPTVCVQILYLFTFGHTFLRKGKGTNFGS
ncbi:hypothetical protein CY35_12G045300 [Sphagnum magellanicum]|nr:hypothetical protein CY35_12G045300 [Sphagnum magellanicum]